MANEVKDVNPKEKMWLVRASTKILGPYNLEEVVQLLVINQISFVDELRRPTSRWSHIREYPFITETVRAKKELLNAEQTKTSPLTTNTQITITASKPQILKPIEVNFDEIKDIEPLRETPFNYAPKGKVNQVVNAPKNFGSLDDQNVKNLIKKSNKNLQIRFFVLVGIVGLALVGLKVFHSMQENRRDKEKFNQIVRLNNLKLYEEAYTLFNDLKESKEIPKEITESISASRVQYGKETNAVRSELIRNVEKVSNSKKKSELLNIIGLTFQMEADSNKAEEYYRNSFIQDPKSEWPFINSLVIKFKKTKNLIMNSELKKEVIKNYKELSEAKTDNFENIGYFTFIRSLTNLEFKDLFRDEISFNLKEIYTARKATAFLRNELQLLSIGLKKADGSISDDDYIELIESLPRVSQKFSKNPLVDWSLTDWGYLDEVCNKIVQNEKQLMSLLLKTYCSLENGQFEKAEQIMNNSVLLAKGSNHYDLMQLHLAFAKGETMKVGHLLKKGDLANFAVSYYYKGMTCLSERNSSCAKEAFANLLNKFPDWAYLANLGVFLADKSQKTSVYEGIRKEPLFRPLLVERANLEKTE